MPHACANLGRHVDVFVLFGCQSMTGHLEKDDAILTTFVNMSSLRRPAMHTFAITDLA